MPKVEISLAKDTSGNWYVKRSAGAGTQTLAFLTVGVEVVSGESGPYRSEAAARKAAQDTGKLLEQKGVTVRYGVTVRE